MTLEQIQKKKAELIAKEKELIKQQKEQERRKKIQENEKRRKLENRVKFIIGGYILKNKPDYINNFLTSDKIRDQDKKTIQEYKKLI